MNTHSAGDQKFLEDVSAAMKMSSAPRNVAVVMDKHRDGTYTSHLAAYCPVEDILFAATYLLHIVAGTVSGQEPLAKDVKPILAALDALPSIVEIMQGARH